ncbi:F-box domain, cyclin-like protein [Cordyceps fumosorosea ARSEF 2679]|uniref:F-box domain, cyclin-like protein n=1 Tax=Cordyceps fumosorosea (strain ARSEF 2679) TaxID=1081104 RepID=A0A168DZA2_CORFA|nr:F-box domain, cyclin-like protein [Cordyceps fumosorosea ARSEF 2679]OAA73180.1 F-box domain, cyclin-like protein [Cordyceps fumosorosea ARSEF 2679]
MALSPLKDWPSELLLSLLELLPLNDLLSMTSVNKAIRTLALPLVYSTVEVRWTWHRLPPVILLLQSLLERPELSGYIRNLRLVGNGFDDRPELEEPPIVPLGAHLLSKASEVIESTRVPFTRFWIDELHSGSVDAIVALLVAMAPNLTALHLGPNFTVRSRLWGGMFRYALSGPPNSYKLPTYHNLRLVEASWRTKEWHHNTVCNAAEVLALFYLPRIQNLSVSIDNPVEFAWPFSHPPAPSSLVSLDIFRLRESRIGPVLSVLKGLQRLHWHWSYQPDLDEEVSKGVLDLDTAAIALNQVAATLTDLTIGAITRPRISDGDYDPPPLELRGSLDGLSRLSKLRKLRLPWVFLMGFSKSPARNLLSALPLSLELLELTADLDDHEEWEWHDDDSIINAIKLQLTSQSISRYTCLRRIVLPIPSEFSEMTEQREKELFTIGTRAGLELGWIEESEDEEEEY